MISKNELFKVITRLSSIIDVLEAKWTRQQSGAEASLLLALRETRETLRKAYEAMESEVKV